MQWFYRFYYYPIINFLVRNLFKILNSVFGLKLRSSISGKVKIPIIESAEIVLETNESGHVAHSLFYEGALNYEFTILFISLIKKCDVFFDIGANIGYFSILANRLQPDIEIHAFEPGQGPIHFLKKNILLNKCKNAKVNELALTNFEGNIHFNEIRNDKYPYLKYFLSGASSTVAKYEHLPGTTYHVSCSTLDLYVRKNNIQKIDLIKLDTEFNEHLVLEKSGETLTKFQPIIISEVYPKVEKEVFEIITTLNYQIFHFSNGILKEIKDFNAVKDTNDRNFFFVTPTKIHLIQPYIR
jgi:FkbM family methyltransferase